LDSRALGELGLATVSDSKPLCGVTLDTRLNSSWTATKRVPKVDDDA
jgi:hypothetical protein